MQQAEEIALWRNAMIAAAVAIAAWTLLAAAAHLIGRGLDPWFRGEGLMYALLAALIVYVAWAAWRVWKAKG